MATWKRFEAILRGMIMSELDTIAPNMKHEVQRTMDEHPEINTMDDSTRAQIIDITDWRINGGLDRPWGRKARNNDPNNPNLNTDAMTYLRPDGNFEIYDVISGVDGSATWDNHGVVRPGENGYWWPPQPIEGGGSEQPPVNNGDMQGQIDELKHRLELLEASTIQYGQRVALQCSNGTVLCAEGGGPSASNEEFNLTSRESIAAWESWTTHRGQG